MHSLTIQWCVKYWHAAYTLVSSPCWCLGWETWNRPGKLAASSVNVAEIWVKPTARLASGTSETPQGHQHSTRIRSGWEYRESDPEGEGIHTLTYIWKHARAQTVTIATYCARSNEHKSGQWTCLHIYLMYSCFYCTCSRTQPSTWWDNS